jgi:hypothetical protein
MYVDGLKHNLLSVSQMCDQGNEVVFSQKNVWFVSLIQERP